MRMKGTVVISCLGLLAVTNAQASEDNQDIFFGGVAGGAVAWIDHAELSKEARPGNYLALQFGGALSRRFSLGGEFTVWQTSVLGTPVHLHTIGPRVEFAPRPRTGLFVAATAGLALTEGELKARAGVGGALYGGYRWAMLPWMTLGFEAGGHAHAYENGAAAFPLVAIQARFYGSRRSANNPP
jgi:hypothetical protein